jgi:hypothetical protein
VAICPFLTENINDLQKTSGCVVVCELNISGHCALRILAQKAIFDLKKNEKTTVKPDEQP